MKSTLAHSSEALSFDLNFSGPPEEYTRLVAFLKKMIEGNTPITVIPREHWSKMSEMERDLALDPESFDLAVSSIARRCCQTELWAKSLARLYISKRNRGMED